MLIFDNNLGKNSDALAIFVSEKYDYKDPRGLLSKEVVSKINSFLKILKGKNEKDEINSLDISDKKKCFIIKIKKKYEKYYPEEIGGTFFSYIKNFKHINSIDLYADSLSENKERTIKFISEFTFGFQLKSYTFNKYKTLNKDKINKKINFKVITSYKEKVKKEYKYYDAIKEGVFLSRDLVSEPPNVLLLEPPNVWLIMRVEKKE